MSRVSRQLIIPREITYNLSNKAVMMSGDDIDLLMSMDDEVINRETICLGYETKFNRSCIVNFDNTDESRSSVTEMLDQFKNSEKSLRIAAIRTGEHWITYVERRKADGTREAIIVNTLKMESKGYGIDKTIDDFRVFVESKGIIVRRIDKDWQNACNNCGIWFIDFIRNLIKKDPKSIESESLETTVINPRIYQFKSAQDAAQYSDRQREEFADELVDKALITKHPTKFLDGSSEITDEELAWQLQMQEFKGNRIGRNNRNKAKAWLESKFKEIKNSSGISR